jgi:hypothetical protein
VSEGFGTTNFNIVGMQQITFGADAAVALTIPVAAHHCLISVSAFGVRLGSATTVPVASTSGVVVLVNVPINFMDPAADYRGAMNQLRICNAVAGSNAVLDIQYYN